MFRLRKFYFAFSFAIILCLVIYASKNFSGTTSLATYATQVIDQPTPPSNITRKAIVSSIPIAVPIIDISRKPKTPTINGQSRTRKYPILKSPIGSTTTAKLGIAKILPYNVDVRPFIVNPEKYALNMARLRIRLDLFGLNSVSPYITKPKTIDQLPPLDIEKQQVLLLTYWRSGSTFVGDILNQHPGTFYHFEPLHSVSGSDVINETMEEKAVNLLSDILGCDFSRQIEYLNWVKRKDNQFLFQHNTRLWISCRIKASMCFDPKFLSNLCAEFPFQVMKVTRLSLRPIVHLLDSHPKLKIIYLVRDPRGILSSRSSLDWCQQTKSCIDPELVCNAMRQDMSTVTEMRDKYPNRLLVLRYEDVSLRPEEKVKELFSFLQLNMHRLVLKYLKSHTHVKIKDNVADPYSTKRDSKMAAFAWKSKLNESHVVAIQETCSDVINGLGYELLYRLPENETRVDV